jgi:hypothetical protein
MSIYNFLPLDLSATTSYPLDSRHSKVTIRDFAQPYTPGSSFANWLQNLPQLLAVQQLQAIAQAIVSARQQQRGVIVGLGGHVIKCGLAPLLTSLMQQGFITAVALNGAAAIHDFEIALVGQTSEDVDTQLGNGQFGMAEETGRYFNEAAQLAVAEGIGYGEALGKLLHSLAPPFASYSLLYQAYQQATPVSVHLAIGTDIVHIHRQADGAALGQATHHDFRLFCQLVTTLSHGGIYLNCGSAVLLPEVFLKAVTVVRNLGIALTQFTTANLDFLQHYRPNTNVVRRPVQGVGNGYSLTGHHELLLPLLAAAILELAQSDATN